MQKLTEVTADHYAEVNLLGFYDITNAIGGIDVCLNKPVRDSYSGENFPAGRQSLAGVQALRFVRQRHGLPGGDLDRIARQQVFLSGMARKVFSQDLLTPGSDTLPKLPDAVSKSMVLDKGWNVLEFAQQMMKFTGGELTFQTIPHGTLALDTPSDGVAVEVDPDEVKQFVRGVIPDDAPSSSQSPPGSGSPSPAAITVNVRNAAGVSGLAARVADLFTDRGFTTGLIDNAQPRKSTPRRRRRGLRRRRRRRARRAAGRTATGRGGREPPGRTGVRLRRRGLPGVRPPHRTGPARSLPRTGPPTTGRGRHLRHLARTTWP